MSESSPVGRRRFLRYVGAGALAVGGATAAYYLYNSRLGAKPEVAISTITRTGTAMTTPTSTRTNHPPVANFDYKPPYLNPTDQQTIHFTNLSTDPDGDPLTYRWLIDHQAVSQDKDYSRRLPVGEHLVELEASDGLAQSTTTQTVTVEPSELYPHSDLQVNLKGVGYYTSKVDDVVRSDLTVIKDELGCNGIRFYGMQYLGGGGQETLFRCAQIAIETGFQNVTVCPRLLDGTREQTIEMLRQSSKRAEGLNDIFDGIVLEVGTELSIDSTAIFSSPDYGARADEFDKKSVPSNPDHTALQEKLNGFLRDLISVARESYHGKLSYGAHPGEWGIPWNELDFDIVGQNQWWWPECSGDQEFIDIFKARKRFGKLVRLTDFGCATYEGAFRMGGAARRSSGPYNEDAQAEGIRHYARLINRCDIDGCFLTPFRDPWEFYANSYGIVDLEHRKKGFYMYKSYQRV